MSKKESHTGFRNGDLFCFHCGQSYHIEMPQPLDMYTAILKQFAKSHKNCIKTWVEPKANANDKTEEQNAMWWLKNGEQGTSSKTIFHYLAKDFMRMPINHQCHPYDPDDFKRCYKLLQAVPQWKDKLYLMKSVSSAWSNLVDNWDKLTEMYEENVRTEWKNYKNIGMYEFMQTLIEPQKQTV